MNIPEINYKLQENHQQFVEFIRILPDELFTVSKNEKWTPGQQLDHIRRSIQPLAQGFQLPKWLIKMIFGKSNRKGRTYDQLVEKYNRKLQEGGRASGRFIPKEVKLTERDKIIQAINKHIKSIQSNLHKFSESELDEIVLPHPLLGKLTIREMMYFTIHHAEHHLKLTQANVN